MSPSQQWVITSVMAVGFFVVLALYQVLTSHPDKATK